MKNRYLTTEIVDDLKEKMVFVAGPRQVGKTTLSRVFVADSFPSAAYFNWDNRADRKSVLSSEWPAEASLIILDEIHKYRQWKRLIKGEYDKLKDKYSFLVTGSARLDLYRRGGDSLQGRYHYYRLHPFSLAEIEGVRSRAEVYKELSFKSGRYAETLELLNRFGGFPEPVMKQNARHLRRWHREKIERMFREDVLDTQTIRDIGSMQAMSDMLPERVASLLSLNAIREDIEVSHRTVSSWMDILESFYYHFRIYPFSAKKIRSLKKEPKLYLWDWSEVQDEGARFENVIASHLLKFIHFVTDSEGYRAELFYLRDVDKREVDFLVTIDGKPWFAVEAKLSDTALSPHLVYFKERLKIPFVYQVVKNGSVDRLAKGARVISASRFLTGLI